MNATIEPKVRAHGLILLTLFPKATERDPVKLCRKLRRLEADGHRLAEDRCNLDLGESVVAARRNKILADLDALLDFRDIPVFLNGDPRGYALKIESEWTRAHAPGLQRDWGGYGIIAPDLS